MIYELHVGTFTPRGHVRRGDRRGSTICVDLGVTAIELMPVADFPGRRNWGYDGVLPFAPDASYGTPEDLKRLVDAAHARGLMVLLDVVYNHFGPEGNYLHAYAPQFFNRAPSHAVGRGDQLRRRRQPHGARLLHPQRALLARGVPLRRPAARRGARDRRRLASRDIVDELAPTVRAAPRRASATCTWCSRTTATRRAGSRATRRGAPRLATRAVERRLAPRAARAASPASATATTPTTRDRPLRRSAARWPRASPTRASPRRYRDGAPRGEPSAHLPPTAFVDFLQNHDQVGNRAFGERIDALAEPEALRAALALLLLAPAHAAAVHGRGVRAPRTPFLFFCDFEPRARRGGARRAGAREFARFAQFARSGRRARAIPDPNDEATFRRQQARLAERERPPGRRVAGVLSRLPRDAARSGRAAACGDRSKAERSRS